MILHGDSLERLREYSDNYFDACVTDPPYGLAFMNKKWDYDVPSVELWREVYRVLKPGAHLLSFGGTRTYHRMVVAIEDAGFEIRDQVQWIYGSGFPKSLNLKNEWQGFGTALKPANEPICLARKPLERGLTVAENVLKWGCGAINVDGSRIGTEIRHNAGAGNKAGGNSLNMSKVGMPEFEGTTAQGRWPANVLFDEDAAAMLDEQSGVSKSQVRKISATEDTAIKNQVYGKGYVRQEGGVNDSGGASRFFYVAKASKRERNAGLEGMPERAASGLPMRSKDGERGGEGIDGTATDRLTKTQNYHPTVKPIKLMEYLCKLITPPTGIVLDPFCGSGSTGVAAKNLGLGFIGIEREAEYVEIAEKRINNV